MTKKRILVFLVLCIFITVALLPLLVKDPETEDLTAQARQRLPGSFITLSDGITHYELTGPATAQTIVLIHGNAAPAVTWDYTVPALTAAGFRVLRYDIYGHGYSDRPDLKAYNKELYDRQLAELLQALDITQPVCLVGTSQGASIAAHYLAQHSEKVAKAAFLGPLVDDFSGKKFMLLFQIPGVGEYFMQLLGSRFFTDPGQGLYTPDKKDELAAKLQDQMHFQGKKRAVLANMRGNSLEDASGDYEQAAIYNIPVFASLGEFDKSIPSQSLSLLQQRLPHLHYHIIPHAAHLAHYERPELLNPLLIEFLRRPSAQI